MNRQQRRKTMQKLRAYYSKLFKNSKLPDGHILELGGLSEQERDRIQRRDWTKKPIRPKHPDQMDTAELEKIRFSGIRINKWTGMCQLWVDGRVGAEAPAFAVARDPTILAEMHERVFLTVGSIVDIEEKK